MSHLQRPKRVLGPVAALGAGLGALLLLSALVLAVSPAGAAGGLQGSGAPSLGDRTVSGDPSLPGDQRVPLPFVLGGSSWQYASNRGTSRVELEERGVEGGARHYSWRIQLLGVGMEEDLILRPEGLFIGARRFFLPVGIGGGRYQFPEPEPVVLAPLEVGNRWEWTGRIQSGTTTAGDRVSGEIEAYEPVSVRAGRFFAYRIRLSRSDGMGGQLETTIWLDPQVGVVRAEGRMRWPGVVGAVQRLLGLDELRMELSSFAVRRRGEEGAQGTGGP